jgi:hypothetical protein
MDARYEKLMSVDFYAWYILLKQVLSLDRRVSENRT